MKKLGVGPGQTFLVNGISGMLGLNAVMLALAMGATRILGIGRNKALLDRVKALSRNASKSTRSTRACPSGRPIRSSPGPNR